MKDISIEISKEMDSDPMIYLFKGFSKSRTVLLLR